MAKGVLKSFQKILATHLSLLFDLKGIETDEKKSSKAYARISRASKPEKKPFTLTSASWPTKDLR